MPSHESSYSVAYAELAVFGFVLLVLSVLVQLFMNTGPVAGSLPGLTGVGSFLMVIGTAYRYFDKGSPERFPDGYTYLSLLGVFSGLVLIVISSLYSIGWFAIVIAGPVVLAYGLSIFGIQIHRSFRLRLRNISILAVILIASGSLLLFESVVYHGDNLTAPVILPFVAGLYLLFIPEVMKNYRYWKQQGYFGGSFP